MAVLLVVVSLMLCWQTHYVIWVIHNLVDSASTYTEELRELIFKSQELYPKIWPGIKWSEEDAVDCAIWRKVVDVLP